MGIPLYCLSLTAFNSLSLSLVFVILVTVCLGVFLIGLILYGFLFISQTWVTVSFPRLGRFSTTISPNILGELFDSLLLWNTYNVNISVLDVFPQVS